MADDKNDRGPEDRARVASGQRYEVDYLMKAHRLTRERALELIAKHHGSRAKIDAELGRP